MVATATLATAAEPDAASPARAIRIVDDRGTTVELPQPPRRIVSLLPSLTETVCALGHCGRLVGVDKDSNQPPQARALPRMGGGIDPSVEAVLATKPDLVLIAASSRAIERLESLGLKVVVLEPRSYSGVRRSIEVVADLLGSGDARRLWQSIEAGVTAAARELAPRASAPRVYFEVSRGPYAAGRQSFIGETLQRLGADNVIPADQGPFPKLNPEFVVRAAPDVILIGERDAASLAQRPGWAAMRAVREQRICALTSDEADVLVRAGPRIAEGARLIARCLAAKAP